MILTCGEAVVDMIPQAGADEAQLWRAVPGGAAVNTAIALARLGQKAGYFGGVSHDSFGDMLCQSMQQEGVDVSRAARVDTASTLAMIQLVNGSPQFQLYDPPCPLAPRHLPSLEGLRALVFGGISLIHAPAAGIFETLMHMAGADRVTLMDPNIRPALLAADSTDYRARVARMMAMADIVKLSDEDLHWLGPSAPDQLLSGRTSLVLHTHGAGGASFYCRHGSHRVGAPKVTVCDSVGAGDTFNAAVLAQLETHDLLRPDLLAKAPLQALHAAVDYGVQAASISVTRLGANPPYAKDMT